MMEDIILANEKMNRWCGTKGINYYDGDTALGLLFKYAVPKLGSASHPPLYLASIAFFYANGKVICKLSFFYVPPKGSYGFGGLDSLQKVVLGDESGDEPIALFRVIQKVFKEK